MTLGIIQRVNQKRIFKDHNLFIYHMFIVVFSNGKTWSYLFFELFRTIDARFCAFCPQSLRTHYTILLLRKEFCIFIASHLPGLLWSVYRINIYNLVKSCIDFLKDYLVI